ncbi:hypothetical protein FQR65_LT07216 [Abscondita terminalis]|nr:hypothetical protein FQR65_LT07216 [Abscondita terminalis]
MFKFDFLKESHAENENNEDVPDTNIANHIWYTAKEILPNIVTTKNIVKLNKTKTLSCGNLAIEYINSQPKIIFPEHSNTCMAWAENNHSDLTTAIYEGGLKIWECTIDLANVIQEYELSFKDKKVLDLGCGAGIIGLLSFLKGADVYFQDYNEEVITFLTIPNVFLNLKEELDLSNCRFYSGDWSSFLELMKGCKFDYIFTSETIYNSSNYCKLYKIFKECLQSDGVVYVAAKTHYFGVGGGIRQFEEYLKHEGLFNVLPCWKCKDGLQREILKVVHLNDICQD